MIIELHFGSDITSDRININAADMFDALEEAGNVISEMMAARLDEDEPTYIYLQTKTNSVPRPSHE